MGEPYIGQGGVVGIAMNADNSGTTWGGTPGTEIALRPYPGTMKWTANCKQSPVADLRVDEGHNVTGGIGYSGSFEIPACYLGLVLPFQGILCGAITTTGAFPRPPGRGFIEARCPMRRRRRTEAFPRPPGRGFNEAKRNRCICSRPMPRRTPPPPRRASSWQRKARR